MSKQTLAVIDFLEAWPMLTVPKPLINYMGIFTYKNKATQHMF